MVKLSKGRGSGPSPLLHSERLRRRNLPPYIYSAAFELLSHKSAACSCTMLDLFSFYRAPRILNVRFYEMSKFNLKKCYDFWKNAKSHINIGFFFSLFSYNISECDFKVLFFYPISMTFGMKVYLVGFMRQIFFLLKY